MPSPDRHFVTTQEAADILGLSVRFFEDVVVEYPWLQAAMIGRGKRKVKRWPLEGVKALAYVLNHLSRGIDERRKGPEGT